MAGLTKHVFNATQWDLLASVTVKKLFTSQFEKDFGKAFKQPLVTIMGNLGTTVKAGNLVLTLIT